eukprot:764262-Hanusia_phi.AAC.3
MSHRWDRGEALHEGRHGKGRVKQGAGMSRSGRAREGEGEGGGGVEAGDKSCRPRIVEALDELEESWASLVLLEGMNDI